MFVIKIRTSKRVEAIDITDKVLQSVKGREGRLLHVYTVHTTCGVVINENADPDVMEDVLEGLDRIIPEHHHYRHSEGNSPAHIKSILTGCSVTIPFSEGRPLLGTWQGIFLLEFDGPRERRVIVTLA